MKHPYQATCDCPRCVKERARRTIQSATDPRTRTITGRFKVRRSNIREVERPTPGSQAWAETRGDDLGESEDR
jgi:hypothetical protein